MVERAENRHQMKNILRPFVMWQLHNDDLIDAIAEQGCELANAFIIGAIPASHSQNFFIDPGNIPAFESALACYFTHNRNAKLAE